MRPFMLRALVVLAFVITSAVVGAAPGEARCVAADVIVYWSGRSDQAAVTDGQCLAPTPFGGTFWAEYGMRVPTPPGTPAGGYVEVWVPLP